MHTEGTRKAERAGYTHTAQAGQGTGPGYTATGYTASPSHGAEEAVHRRRVLLSGLCSGLPLRERNEIGIGRRPGRR